MLVGIVGKRLCMGVEKTVYVATQTEPYRVASAVRPHCFNVIVGHECLLFFSLWLYWENAIAVVTEQAIGGCEPNVANIVLVNVANVVVRHRK